MKRLLPALILALLLHGLLLWLVPAWHPRKAPARPSRGVMALTLAAATQRPDAETPPRAAGQPAPPATAAKPPIRKAEPPPPTVEPAKPRSAEPVKPPPPPPEPPPADQATAPKPRPVPEPAPREPLRPPRRPILAPEQRTAALEPSETAAEPRRAEPEPQPPRPLPATRPPTAASDPEAADGNAGGLSPARPASGNPQAPQSRVGPEAAAADRNVRTAVPLYRKNPPPPYPAAARRRRMQGKVVLRVFVDARGRVADLEVAASSGHALLDRAAEKAVRQWRFQPARRGDQTMAMWVRVPIRFRLH